MAGRDSRLLPRLVTGLAGPLVLSTRSRSSALAILLPGPRWCGSAGVPTWRTTTSLASTALSGRAHNHACTRTQPVRAIHNHLVARIHAGIQNRYLALSQRNLHRLILDRVVRLHTNVPCVPV